MTPGITVLLCTFNGSERLPQTLAHLAAQECPREILWELILIDNASTDNTAEVALAEWLKHGIKNAGFRILHEPQPGKIHALQKGIAFAQFNYFVICDDDNWLMPDYIANAFDLMEQHPNVGAAGGKGIAVAEQGLLPAWFSSFEKHYAVGPQDEEDLSGEITYRRGYLWGAGMVSRTALFKEMYENLPFFLTGRKNTALIGGEDTEYCLRLVLSDYQLWYDETLLFKHFMPARRLEVNYRDALVATLEEDRLILDKYYLVIKMKRKCKGRPLNKLRLFFVTPFRYLMTTNENKKLIELWKMRYLFPFKKKRDPVLFAIKQF